IRIGILNIEGISQAKCEFLSRIITEHEIDIVLLQETHTENEEQLNSRGRITNFDLIGATYHKHYGVATYVRSDIQDVSLHHISDIDDIYTVTVKVGETLICNVYKPPSTPWPSHVLETLPHPAVYIGDFNSHHETWKYDESDQNGEDLVLWAELQNLNLIFDAKDYGTFHSAAWKKDYNPDLCFVSTGPNDQPLATTRLVIPNFPRSQHRPVILEIGISIPIISTVHKPRWNFRKAKWDVFQQHLDNCLKWIQPTVKNYKRFCGAVTKSAKKAMPRGYRKEYIPGWNEGCEALYGQYLDSQDQSVGDELLKLLDQTRRERWVEKVEKLDFKKSSREAWSLLNKLDGRKKIKQTSNPIHPNKVAAHIVNTSRSPRDRQHTIDIKRRLRTMKRNSQPDSEYSSPFTLADITVALSETKSNKAPGFDGIHAEFLKNSGDFAKAWMAKFLTDVLNTGQIPNELKKAKIIALLKPGKAADQPGSYRPVALLSCVYKLLERLIYNRVSEKIYSVIPVEQAGFRPGRNCADQVLALTNHIEAGFQLKLKNSVAFIDLSAAYDTVWREGLLYKFLQVIPCSRTLQLLDNMLSNRNFKVVMNESMSNTKKLNNGLPQGSVLAPLLFSLYISDIPETKSKKFGYADDWAIAVRTSDIHEAETILTEDLAALGRYFRQWRLKPNASKTEITCFHLNNQQANLKLKVEFEGELLNHNFTPKYLGVTLDRTLTFKPHLQKTAAKLKSRNNIIQKLCGSKWGSSSHVLRTSALGLVYSAAEYCAPVWLNCNHTDLVDVQLNNTMRIITGSIKPTPTFWLPILSNIPPPKLRRENALLR
ncbi:hypothetical protein WDU94_013986, partial [Cyamophila willieti]